MDLSPVILFVLVVAMFGSGFVNGTIGFGFALLAVNVLAAILGTKDGILTLTLMTPAVSGLQLWHHRDDRAISRRLRILTLTALVGVILGSEILVYLPGAIISLALGLLTVFDVIVELRGRRPPLASGTERRLAPVAGFVGGVSTGALGASGPVFGSYLVAIGIRGGEFAFAISAVFLSMSIVRNGVLSLLGQYTLAMGALALLLLVPTFTGQSIGFWLRGRLPAHMIERAVLILLLVASVNLVYRGIAGLFGTPA
jgi:uncharacterized membrane protein YfcA